MADPRNGNRYAYGPDNPVRTWIRLAIFIVETCADFGIGSGAGGAIGAIVGCAYGAAEGGALGTIIGPEGTVLGAVAGCVVSTTGYSVSLATVGGILGALYGVYDAAS